MSYYWDKNMTYHHIKDNLWYFSKTPTNIRQFFEVHKIFWIHILGPIRGLIRQERLERGQLNQIKQ